MVKLPLANRETAGDELAQKLQHYQNRDNIIVLALPRGGVPVAYEVAQALDAPLELMVVRKLGLPMQKEFAMGAIASGGARVIIDRVVNTYGVSGDDIEKVIALEQKELERRERAYRGDRPPPDLRGRCVILVDDGLATGATMRAAIKAVSAQGASEIVVAVPVAPWSTSVELERLVDELVILAMPDPFYSVGQWYAHFGQTSDEEVQALLNSAWEREQEHEQNHQNKEQLKPHNGQKPGSESGKDSRTRH